MPRSPSRTASPTVGRPPPESPPATLARTEGHRPTVYARIARAANRCPPSRCPPDSPAAQHAARCRIVCVLRGVLFAPHWDIICIRIPRMTPGAHYHRSAKHQCRWHTGCNKRFSSKRQLFEHLESEHGLSRASKTFRATGFGARLRRQNQRANSNASPSLSRPPEERQEAAERQIAPSSWWLEPLPTAARAPARVSFASRNTLSSVAQSASQVARLATAEMPPSAGGAQPSRGIGREAVMGCSATASSAARPPPFPAPAERPPLDRGGSSTSAARPPSAFSADRPPSNACDEGASAPFLSRVSPRPAPP